jgi:hypothetical protein
MNADTNISWLLDARIRGVFFTVPRLVSVTPLFNIPPRGEGTGQVQSLLDYLRMLSALHRVALNALIELLLGLIGKASSITQFRQLHGRRCNGQARIARTLVEAASLATGRPDLAGCTVLPLSGFFSEQWAMNPQTRYCPLCFMETPSGQIPYMRLLWCLSPVNCCPEHQVRLVTPICGAPVASRDRNVVLADGVCARCGSVGLRCFKARLVRATQEQVWVASQVSELLAAQSALALSGPARAKEFLKRYCVQSGCSMLQVAARADLTPSVLSTFIKEPGRRMELGAFIRIAAAEGLSLVGILDGSGGRATIRATSEPLERRQPSSVRGRNWQQVGAKAPLALAAGHGLASWAKELGVPPRSLVMRLPKDCAALTSQKQARRADERLERMRRLVAECEAIATVRWSEKGVLSPLGHHHGRRLNGERPLILKSLELLLIGSCVGAAWPPEVEQLIVEAADRILASCAVRRACS